VIRGLHLQEQRIEREQPRVGAVERRLERLPRPRQLRLAKRRSLPSPCGRCSSTLASSAAEPELTACAQTRSRSRTVPTVPAATASSTANTTL